MLYGPSCIRLGSFADLNWTLAYIWGLGCVFKPSAALVHTVFHLFRPAGLVHQEKGGVPQREWNQGRPLETEA